MRQFMISLGISLLVTVTLFLPGKSQDTRWEEVDKHVSNVNKQAVFHPQLLANLLIDDLSNDYDKVRAFYVWIATNIEYDLLAFIHGRRNEQGINEVLRSGKALCTGFSLLFDYFCDQAGIPCEIIEGYTKGYGYRKNQKFKRTNHAWNAVNIYGKWYLLDVTWATGDPRYLSKHQKNIDLDTYFFADSEMFIETHLPEDPSWQLLDDKISIHEFETGEKTEDRSYAINAFSPNDYNELDEYDRDLLRYNRATQFNPRNIELAERLSFAYLYKGISITDRLWKMDYQQLMDTIASLESNFYAYMDSARMTIEVLNGPSISSVKQIVHDEINYQKGIINYEIGTELFSKAMQKDISVSKIGCKADNYFKQAESYFKNVPVSSIYHKDAEEYLLIIKEFRQRKFFHPIPD